MTHALITGGGGFIGLHLARRLLKAGVRVTLVDNFSRGARDGDLADLLRQDGAELRSGDLRDPETWRALPRDVTRVFHFAAILGVRNVLERAFEVLGDNVAMTVRALAWARTLPGLSRFVFASTSEVYAGTLAAHGLAFPTPESTPLVASDLAHPRSSYMLSKIQGEALCHQAGVPFTIVRPHNVYGPRMGMAHVVPELMKKAWEQPEGGRLEVFSPDHRRTFCYVDDAVAMIDAISTAAAGLGGTFNVGVESPEVEIRELAERILACVGRTLPLALGDTTPGSPSRRCPDISRLTAATGVTPQVSLDAGLARTFEWYRRTVFAPAQEAK